MTAHRHYAGDPIPLSPSTATKNPLLQPQYRGRFYLLVLGIAMTGLVSQLDLGSMNVLRYVSPFSLCQALDS
jgi:hypothetical protein